MFENHPAMHGTLKWFWMLALVTPIHESMHWLFARMVGDPVRPSGRGIFFDGEMPGVRSWRLLMGAVGNLALPWALTHLLAGIHPLATLVNVWATFHYAGAFLEIVQGDVRDYLREKMGHRSGFYRREFGWAV